MKHQPRPIAAAVALAMLGAGLPAWAEEAATGAPATVKEEAVVVTGIRASKFKSLTAKKNADSLVEVISAEDIGKMPDKNVADSLQRVPGVNTITASGTEGGFGENDRVSMRGTPPSLTATTINGHAVGTGDWYVLNQSASGRSVSYSLLPSELVDTVVISKSARADLVEGGVAGSVDIQTRHPLDAKKPLSASGSVEYVYSDLSAKWDPQLSGQVNWKNDAGNFGVLLQAFSEKRQTRRDGQEFLWWDTIDNLWGKNKEVLAAHPDLKGKYVSLLTGSAYFEQERKRDGGLIAVQFKPSSDINLELTGFSSKLKASNYNRNAMQWAVSPLTHGVSPSKYTISGGTVTSLEFPSTCPAALNGDCGGSLVTDQIARPGASAKSQFINLAGKFKASDRLTLSGKLGSTKGEGSTPRDIGFEVGSGYTGGSYNLHGIDNPADVVIPGADKYAPNADGIGGWGSSTLSVDKERYAQADGDYHLGLGALESVKFGVRFSKHERQLESFKLKTLDAGKFVNVGPTSLYPGDFGSHLGGSVLKNVWQLPMSAVVDWSNKYQVLDGRNLDTEFRIEEPVTAAYAMATLGTDNLRGNIGVRVVHTKEDVHNNRKDKNGVYQDVLTSNSYTDILPSANLKLELSPSLIARMALSKTMSRPDFGALGSLTLNDLVLSGSGGNPNLKPVRATNFDIGAEWYYAPKSLLSVGLYHMDLSSYVSYGTYKQTFFNQTQGRDTEYTLTAAQNTTGRVQGFEVALEQPLAYGFGFNTNYTYANGKETSAYCQNLQNGGESHACDLVGTAKHSYNLGAYYEKNGFSARLAYNYRSAFLNGVDRKSAIYQDAVGTLMGSLSYTVSDNLTLTLDAKDLNNPVLKSYVYDKTGAKQPRSFYTNGRQYYLGLRMKY
ncbi:TonB-dependent receptor [Chitinimonas arctica]|uniref:TonB-dependent receptor n=2 Tax=Chitinimonas arctica TaxID=2594795 RepID=A0A516SDW0_9NEIS|nr:TonB-dependent receptor [Chitinimonas arctica]